MARNLMISIEALTANKTIIRHPLEEDTFIMLDGETASHCYGGTEEDEIEFPEGIAAILHEWVDEVRGAQSAEIEQIEKESPNV